MSTIPDGRSAILKAGQPFFLIDGEPTIYEVNPRKKEVVGSCFERKIYWIKSNWIYNTIN